MTKDTSSKEYSDLKVELRSILISSQEGCTEQQLLKVFAEYNSGKEIPFRRMGYKSLIELLASMPDVARIDQRRPFIVIHGVPDDTTRHISDFVKQQKRSKKSTLPRGGMVRSNFPNRFNAPPMPRMNRPVCQYEHDHHSHLFACFRYQRIHTIMAYHFSLIMESSMSKTVLGIHKIFLKCRI